MNDVDSRGGIHENSNSLNGSGWEVDFGFSKNRVRRFKYEDGILKNRLLQPYPDFAEEQASKKSLERILSGKPSDER